MPDVAAVLRAQNANIPKGQLQLGETSVDILANDQIRKADQYKDLIVGFHQGAAIKLSDVADVVDSVQSVRAAGYMDGKPSVLLIIFRAPGANIIDTVNNITAALPQLKASVPGGIDFTVVLGPHHHHSRVGERRRALADHQRCCW